MSDEELKIMKEKVEEAHGHLIELNDAYNELLAKEHEEKAKKNNFSQKNMSMDEFFEVLKEIFDIETTPKTEEEKEIEKSNTQYTIRLVIIILLGLLFSPWAILPAAFLVLINAVYLGKKNNKIREKYKSKASDAKEEKKETEKTEKDALYEELCGARRVYQTLRKEFETMMSNSNLNNVDNQEVDTVEESLGVAEDTVDPKVYEIYSEYIKYVKNICSLEGSRISTFNSKTYELKNEDYNQTRI